MGALREIRAAALVAGVELVPLKGAAMLERGLYRPGERQMTDVDTLVRPGDIEVLEKVLAELGFVPMPKSSDAWLRPGAGNAPPAIIDIHTGLWHIGDTDELFRWGLEPGPSGLALNITDLFLHAASHPLLYHGELTARALEDCSRIAARAFAEHGERFWPGAARKAGVYSLRPVVWPVISRMLAKGLLAAEAAGLFRPRGAEKIKAALFEKAAGKHSTPLEYLLPVLQRPSLAFRYALPSKSFMVRRYGAATLALYALRPLKLLYSMLTDKGRD